VTKLAMQAVPRVTAAQAAEKRRRFVSYHMPAKTGRKQDTQFKPGQSGNPHGRPQGSRHKTTLAVERCSMGTQIG